MAKFVTATIITVFIFMIPRLQAQDPGDVGSPECGAIQEMIQQTVGDEDPAVYRNHGAYVSAVAGLLTQFLGRGEITGKCSSCVINQFARRIPIADQKSCGLMTPTQSCEETNPTPEQIEEAVIEAMGTISNPWGDASDFELLLELTEAKLDCLLRPGSSVPTTADPAVCSFWGKLLRSWD